MTVPGWPEVFRGTAAIAAGPSPRASASTATTRYPGLRGVRRVIDVLCWTDPRSGSPPETRLRLILVRAGLPRPVPQHPVVDDHRRILWLDLAYPAAARADAQRHTRLVAAGWRVLRYTSEEMQRAPDRIVAEVRRALHTPPRGRRPA